MRDEPNRSPASFELSEYGRRSSCPSPVNRMMAAFASDFRDGLDVNLGVGYVNEQTIPKESFVEALGEVCREPGAHRAAFNYGGPRGSSNLIAAAKRFLVRQHGVSPAAAARNELIIGPSGATSLLQGIAAVLAPGIVVTTDPMYYIYCNFLERRGFEVVTVPEDAEGMCMEALERRIDALGADVQCIRFVYAVTVSNPTCTILSNSRRLGLVDAVSRLSRRLGRRVPLVLDCAYEALIHDPSVAPPVSGLNADELGIVYEVGSLSKVLAPALRIGTMIGPDSAFLRAMVQHTSDVGFSAPMMTQEVAEIMLERHCDEQLRRVTAGYREKSRCVGEWLREMLGDAVVSCTGGQAGFYFYLTLRDVETSEGSPFFRFLTRTTGDPAIDGPDVARKARVIYIPGEYCVHPRGPLAAVGRRQLRLSYGFEELRNIKRAVHHMREALEYARSCEDGAAKQAEGPVRQ